MEAKLDTDMSDSELVSKIFARNVSEHDLRKEFDISDSALRSYKRCTTPRRSRSSLPIRKLRLLELSLSFLDKKGLEEPFEALKKVTIDDVPLLTFIDSYAKDESAALSVRHALKLMFRERRGKAIDRYREKYGYLNDDTLAKATDENPELLKELVDDESLRPSTRGDVLEHLAVGARAEYFDFIKSKAKAIAPHIREAAFIALYEYYDSDPKTYDVKSIFDQALEVETADGVRATLTNLREEM